MVRAGRPRVKRAVSRRFAEAIAGRTAQTLLAGEGGCGYTRLSGDGGSAADSESGADAARAGPRQHRGSAQGPAPPAGAWRAPRAPAARPRLHLRGGPAAAARALPRRSRGHRARSSRPSAVPIGKLSLKYLRRAKVMPLAQRTARSSSRWPTRSTTTRSRACRSRPASRSSRGSRASATSLEALEQAYGGGGGRRRQRRRRRRRRGRVRRRRRGGRQPPPRPRERGAGHPAREHAHQPRRRAARVGHPHRAVRERAQGPLPHRRRAPRRRDAAAPPPGRDRLAHQDHGEARHRRAPPAAGRPHQAPHDGQGDRPPRLDAADALRRERRAPHPRPLEHRP